MNELKEIHIQPGDRVMNVYTKKWATVLQVEEKENNLELYVQPEREEQYGLSRLAKMVPATSWPATVIGGWRPRA